MTWNSSCSIASDDDQSRHSFLSDCDSEYDLRPPPRYPAEKRTYSGANRHAISRTDPPMTRSRAKAIGQTIVTPEPLPPQRRHSTLRRSMDAFTGMTISSENNSILFPKQDSSSDRVLNGPLDGVNILADRFESCSLDEDKLSRNCLWPSRETNSHYTRPINSRPSPSTFGAIPFSNLFAQPSTQFGQQQAQLWSRFRFAASTLRDDLSMQQVPSNLLAFHSNPFQRTEQPSVSFLPQTVPTRTMTFQPTPSSLFTQRQITSMVVDPPPPSTPVKEDVTIRSFPSKFVFTLAIFAVGLIVGCLLTNTFPPGLIWEICVKYFHVFCAYLENGMK